jgi:hypothetical protein
MRMRSLVILAGLVVGLATAWQTPHASAQQQGPACLHGPNETAAERDRRNAGLGLARALNTAQAGFASRNKGLYGTLSQLSGLPDLDAGAFEVKLVSNGGTYAFSIRDSADPCGFTFFSNEIGVIHTGAPLDTPLQFPAAARR